MEKLRLDYFLSLGLKLVEGDVFTSVFGEQVKVVHDTDKYLSNGVCTVTTSNEARADDNRCFITSFAPRKNTGEQPCGGDVPVIVTWESSGIDEDSTDLAKFYDWDVHNLPLVNITHWKPGLDALIKMQNEHDKGTSKRKEQEDKQKIVDAVNYFESYITSNFDFKCICESLLNDGYVLADSDAYVSVGAFICTIEEFNQCVKEMSEARWMTISGDFYCYESYKEDYQEPEQKPVEWVNGMECVCLSIGKSVANYIGRISACVGDVEQWCAIQYGNSSLEIVTESSLSKPETEQQQADRERDEKALALFKIFASALANIDCGNSGVWDKQTDRTKSCYLHAIDAGVKLPE